MEGWKVITDISWGHMGNFFFLQLERQKGLGFRSPPKRPIVKRCMILLLKYQREQMKTTHCICLPS